MNKLTQWVLNIVAGIFFFILFLILFFPLESIVRHFLSQVEVATKGSYKITVGEMEPNVLFKSVFKNFQLHKVDKGATQLIADIPELKIGVSYLALIGGTVRASFVALGRKGEMEGDLILSQNEVHLDSEMDGFSLQNVPYLSDLLTVPMEGRLNGKADLDLFPKQMNKNRAKIDLKLQDFKIPASKVTPYPGVDLDLPETNLSGKGGVLKGSLDKGKLTLDQFALPGDDLSVTVSGTVQLSPRFPLSRLNLEGNFRVSEKISQSIPLLVVIEKQKGEDGSYPVTITGRFNRPNLTIGTFEVL